MLPVKPAVSGWHTSYAASPDTHMVKASPGIQVTETPLLLWYSLFLLFPQSPDSADNLEFIDDGSSNPGTY